jgi:hypothetical protein
MNNAMDARAEFVRCEQGVASFHKAFYAMRKTRRRLSCDSACSQSAFEANVGAFSRAGAKSVTHWKVGVMMTQEQKIRAIEKAKFLDQELMTTKSRWRRRYLHWVSRNLLSYYFVAPPLWKIWVRSRLSKRRVAPSFAVLGAVRSGTSALSDYVVQHPCVVLPLAKEPFVIPRRRLLLAQFPTEEEMERVKKKYGAAVTGYCNPQAPDLRIPFFARNIAPQGKFVLILRDPVQRSFAQWRWDKVLLAPYEKDPLFDNYPGFSEIVSLELEALRSGGCVWPTFSGVDSTYIQTSIYLPFVRLLYRLFDKDNILVVKAEDFFADPTGTAKQVYSFLGLPGDYTPVKIEANNPGPPGRMEDSTRQELVDFFRPLNEQLYDFLGRDLGWD